MAADREYFTIKKIKSKIRIKSRNRKYFPKDRCRYFDIARGSALECAAALDVTVARELLKPEKIVACKALLQQIVSMLVGLIKSHSEDRVYETQTGYGDQLGHDSI